MKAFIDYQRKISHRVYVPSRDRVYKVEDRELMDFLRMKGIDEVYIESAPKKWIYRLLQDEIEVYVLRRHNQNSLRRKYDIRKSHENDARLLYMMYKENPNYFRKYVKRHLDNDPDIQRYVLLLREIRKTRQKIRINEKLGLPIEKLKDYLTELQRKQMKLFYHLKRKYSDILDKFSDIKGLSGGNLLYFLTLIPEINSFESIRSFLIYLGLRDSQGKRWNREARQALIKIAMKTSQYNSIKFDPKNPDWKYLREIAILIYTRLREKVRDSEVY